MVGKAAVWWFAALLLTGMVVVPFLYFPEVAKELPPHADSSVIPIGGAILSAIILLPAIVGMTWLCTRSFRSGSLFAWRQDRLAWSIVATALFAASAGPLAWLMVTDYGRPLPSHEYYWVPVGLAAICWLATLRTALISKSRHDRERSALGRH